MFFIKIFKFSYALCISTLDAVATSPIIWAGRRSSEGHERFATVDVSSEGASWRWHLIPWQPRPQRFRKF